MSSETEFCSASQIGARLSSSGRRDPAANPIDVFSFLASLQFTVLDLERRA